MGAARPGCSTVPAAGPTGPSRQHGPQRPGRPAGSAPCIHVNAPPLAPEAARDPRPWNETIALTRVPATKSNTNKLPLISLRQY